VTGDLIVFNDNGAWSWFEGERVIVDEDRGRILLSSVANSHGMDGMERGGDIEVIAYDLVTRVKQRFILHKHLQEDDHNSAALLLLPDGRYLASYSKHASDNQLHYRVSSIRGEVTNWQPEQVFRAAGGITYSNLYYLAKTNTVFNFHRDRGNGFDPNYLLWQLKQPIGFHYGGHLLTGPEGNHGNRDRPYLRYVGNGVDRIHFMATDHHPRDLISNSVYHGYLEAESQGYGLYRSDGTRLGDLSRTDKSPLMASDFTRIFAGNSVSPTNNLLMTRGWLSDIELDAAGYPYVAFTARVNDNDRDHRYFYGRYVRTAWQVHELAKAGGYLYEREKDYTGLVALDPNSPDHLFISTPIDPRTEAELAHYEIYEGTTTDGGETWTWSPVTAASTVDNLRPILPRGIRGGFVLLWMRGHYKSYTDYDTSIVGFVKLTGERAATAVEAKRAK
jgi:hypothetical protein